MNYFFRIKCSETLFYVKYASIISGGLFISSPFEGGEARNRDGGGLFERGGGLIEDLHNVVKSLLKLFLFEKKKEKENILILRKERLSFFWLC